MIRSRKLEVTEVMKDMLRLVGRFHGHLVPLWCHTLLDLAPFGCCGASGKSHEQTRRPFAAKGGATLSITASPNCIRIHLLQLLGSLANLDAVPVSF